MLNIGNRIKSFIQSNLLIISIITISSLSIIAFINRDSSNSLTLIQTIIAIVVLVPVILSLPELMETLRKYNAKPDFKITLKGHKMTRAMAEALSNEDLWGQEEVITKLNISELKKYKGGPDSEAILIIRNIGTGTLYAPIIRLMPIEAKPTWALQPYEGTGFERELEGFVLYNPIGHLMSKDTVVYSLYYNSGNSDYSGTFKYKLTIRGADQEEVWTFPFTLIVESP